MKVTINKAIKPRVTKDWDAFKDTEFESLFKYSTNSEEASISKSVCVMFSGGYDSTALIIENLKKGYHVYPVEVIFNEYDHLIKLITLYQLKQIYQDKLHPLITLANTLDIKEATEFETRGWNQQPICGFYAAFIPAYILNKVSEIQIAYVVGDGAISYLDNLEMIYKNTIEFKNHQFEVPKLTFPFKKRFHEDNVALVNEYNLPCYAGDNTQKFCCGKKETKKAISYYICIDDEVRDTLNKAGNINETYTIEVVIEKEEELTNDSL